MTDTKFPLPREGWSGDTDLLDPRLVDDWFKRCMEDSPIHKTKYGLWEEWAEKWLGQFIDQSEEIDRVLDSGYIKTKPKFPVPISVKEF